MHRSIRALAIVLGAMFAMSAITMAAVTFDPETGEGFVGKGDVQDAFGWNNKQLQDNAEDVTFTYEDEATYDILCEQQQTSDRRTFRRSAGIDEATDGDPRQKKGQKQFTGFILSGYDGTVESGDAECPGGFNEVSRTLVGTSGGGLYAHWNGQSVLIWSPSAEE
jgi:hypothetical protein